MRFLTSRKGAETGYWLCTLALLLPLGFGGVMDLLRPPQVLEVIRRLGYPDYFPLMLGTAKLLGLSAILCPRSGRLKEWAYAGFVFNLLAAFVSHVAVGDPAGRAILPLAVLSLVLGSLLFGRARDRFRVLPPAVAAVGD